MECILKQIKTNFGKVKKVSLLLNKNALLMLYNSLIKHHLTYCISFWYFRNTAIIYKFQCSVNKFIQLIFNSNYRTDVTHIIKKKAVAILPSTAIYPQRLFCHELFVIGQSK